jgi:E3 ubiquitin-protein ligase RNF5
MATSSEAGPSREGSKESEEKEKDERMFECNICLDTARDAVVSMCGHLFW